MDLSARAHGALACAHRKRQNARVHAGPEQARMREIEQDRESRQRRAADREHGQPGRRGTCVSGTQKQTKLTGRNTELQKIRFDARYKTIRNQVGTEVGMELQLPHPISSYVRAENSGDVDAISKCFTPYATLRKDHEYIEGRPAIKAWKATVPEQNITPLAIDVAGRTATLKARVSGKHPGNPITAEFHFALVDDQIASLQIRSQPGEWLS